MKNSPRGEALFSGELPRADDDNNNNCLFK